MRQVEHPGSIQEGSRSSVPWEGIPFEELRETVRWLKHPGSGRARQEPRKLGKGGGHRKGEIWRSLFLSGGFH